MTGQVTGTESGSHDRLLSLTIAGFRGFNESVTLSFDASAVLLHGPNGSGKTSVFDAVQWLFTAALPRLAPYGLRKTDQYLRNAFASTTQASVEATFVVDNSLIRVTRRGDLRLSSLEVEDSDCRVTGPEAEAKLRRHLAPGSLPLAEVLHTSGLLQQDDLRQILQTKPDARYRQLMRLLGLEALEQFEQFVRDRKAQARSRLAASQQAHDEAIRRHALASEQLETSELQVDRVSAMEDLLSGIQSAVTRIPETWTLAADRMSAERLPEFAVEIGRRRAQIAGILNRLNELPGELPADPDSDDLVRSQEREAAEIEVAAASEALLTAEGARSEATAVSDSLAKLSAAAIPLLPDHHDLTPCPVCATEIDPHEVRSVLEARSTDGRVLAVADQQLLAARSQLQIARQRLQEIEQEEARAQAIRDERARWLSEAAGLRQALQGLGEGSEFGLNAVRPLVNSDGDAFTQIASSRDALVIYLDALDFAASAIEDAAREMAQQQAATRLAMERQSALPRQRESVMLLLRRVEECAARVEEERKTSNAASALADGTTAANASVFRQRFQTLEPLMNDVYARLDPHPAFTHLSFSVESFRSKGTASATVLDSEREITVNPMLVFSSAQANIVVLSAFLALGWAAGNGSLPFVMLDDPLQAMDDVNVLGFADLARHLRRDRQLILATHESRFANLLERKLTGVRAGEDLIVHKFVGWSRNGPEIETIEIGQAEDPNSRVLIA